MNAGGSMFGFIRYLLSLVTVPLLLAAAIGSAAVLVSDRLSPDHLATLKVHTSRLLDGDLKTDEEYALIIGADIGRVSTAGGAWITLSSDRIVREEKRRRREEAEASAQRRIQRLIAMKVDHHLRTEIFTPRHPNVEDNPNDYLIEISVSKRTMHVYRAGDNDQLKEIGTYSVATPRRGVAYPKGEGKIAKIEINPWWYPTPHVADYLAAKGVEVPDEVPPGSTGNAMGPFKMILNFGNKGDNGYRIHGNTNERAIGRRVTSGCIRMKNNEGLNLVHLIPVGTTVKIVD